MDIAPEELERLSAWPAEVWCGRLASIRKSADGLGRRRAFGSSLRALGCGTVVLSQPRRSVRVWHIQDACRELCAAWRPDVIVLERAFVARNVQSALRLGEVRGVVLAAVAASSAELRELTPAEAKLGAVGHGAADKNAVARGVRARLALAELPAPDAADALALALCLLERAPLEAAIAAAERRGRA
jgi:crossover junction endodeoxyribonuclease RuvC